MPRTETLVSHAEAIAILAEYGIEIVARNVWPKPGQTRAVETIRKILARHGEGHLRLVLTTLAETANNNALLDEVGLWMASDMVLACPKLIEQRTSEWLDLWDAMPLAAMREVVRSLSGIICQRTGLAGMVYERIFRRFGSITISEPGEAVENLDNGRLMQIAEIARSHRRARQISLDIFPIAERCGVRLSAPQGQGDWLVPMECFARPVLLRIGRERGADHLELVLRLITHARRNAAALYAEVITAVSDLVASPLVKANEALFQALDAIDLTQLRLWALGVSGASSASDTILAVLKYKIIGPDVVLRPETVDECRAREARERQYEKRARRKPGTGPARQAKAQGAADLPPISA